MKFHRLSQELSLRIIFVSHLLPIVCAGLEWNWLRNGYYIHNFFFLLTLLWCLQDKRSTEAVLIAATLDILGVLIDATCILISWDNVSIYGGTKILVVLNLVFRPLTAFLLLRYYKQRKNQLEEDEVTSPNKSLGSGKLGHRSGSSLSFDKQNQHQIIASFDLGSHDKTRV